MEKLFGMELCKPPVPDLGALMDEPESRVLPFRGSVAVKDVDRVADGQTGRPAPLQPATQNRGRSRHDREGRREEGGRQEGVQTR